MVNNESIKKIFGSNTRVKLFNLFFNNQSQKYYVREITRIINEQINSVRRELNNLYDIGIINKTEEERKVYYSLNKNFEFYNALAAIFDDDFKYCCLNNNKEEPLNWLKEIKNIKDIIDCVYIGGQFKDIDSEIDLLLVGNEKDLLSNWASGLEEKIKKDIRYVILSTEDFSYRKAVKDDFLLNFLNSDIEKIY